MTDDNASTLSVQILRFDPEGSSVPEGYMWFNLTEHTLKRMVSGKAVPVASIASEKPNTVHCDLHPSKVHYHKDADGFLHRCMHKCRSLFTWQFFLGITLSFPFEHLLWTKVWPFYVVAEFFGLGLIAH